MRVLDQAQRWRHADFDARTLPIKTAIGETNVVYEKDTKNHQHRTVTLSEFAVEWSRSQAHLRPSPPN